MKPTDITAPSQTEALTLAFDLAHPPSKVWRALTDPVLLSEWLQPIVELKLEPGAAFVFQTPAHPGWDGIVHCRVLEVEAPKKISYTWGAIGLDTVVTFTLTPTPSGTHLLLVQSGFKPEQKQAFGGARYGWNMMGTRLIEHLAKLP
jgi:uncharacterized protein YndB with AHSA1/START domain